MKKRNAPKLSGLENITANLKPYRYYQSGLMNGHECFVMKADGGATPLTNLMALGDVINVDKTKKLMKDCKLHDLIVNHDELCYDLNLMRVTVPAKQALPDDWQDPVNALGKMLRRIGDDIPCVIRIFEEGIARQAGSPQNLRRSDSIAALEQLAGVVRKVQKRIGFSEPSNRSALWHDDALYLGWYIKTAGFLQQRELSITKATSPAVDFVCQALALAGIALTGTGVSENEQPHSAVAKAISRGQKRLKRECVQLRNQSAPPKDS